MALASALCLLVIPEHQQIHKHLGCCVTVSSSHSLRAPYLSLKMVTSQRVVCASCLPMVPSEQGSRVDAPLRFPSSALCVEVRD